MKRLSGLDVHYYECCKIINLSRLRSSTGIILLILTELIFANFFLIFVVFTTLLFCIFAV